MHGTLPERLVLFDGVCNLCSGVVRFIIRHDRRCRFHFAPLQGSTAARLGLPANADSLVYLRKDEWLTESAAALAIARDLGWPWRALLVLHAWPRFLRDAAYRFIARHRYRWFGRKAACMVPDAATAARFLP